MFYRPYGGSSHDPPAHWQIQQTRKGYLLSRPPSLPARDSIPKEDHATYDRVIGWLNTTSRPAERNQYASAVLNSPPFAGALFDLSKIVLATGERPGSYVPREREFENIVIAFDSGHYEALEAHLEYAVKIAGISIESIFAVWEGRDDDLPDDERQLVDYIRAFVAGAVTDEQWGAMTDRFGQRGAVEYTITVAYELQTVRLMQAFGTSTISREQMQAKLESIRAGTNEPIDKAPYERRAKAFREMESLGS